MSTFQPGPDARRNRAGRPPSNAGIARLIRRELGRDAPAIVARVAALARSGDDLGIVAAAALLGAVIGEPE